MPFAVVKAMEKWLGYGSLCLRGVEFASGFNKIRKEICLHRGAHAVPQADTAGCRYGS